MKSKAFVVGTLCSLVLAVGIPVGMKKHSEHKFMQAFKQEQKENQRMSDYLSDACSDGLESVILYLPKLDEIIDLSAKRKNNKVTYKRKLLLRVLENHDDVVIAHCHIITYEKKVDSYDLTTERGRSKYLRATFLGKDIVEKRLYEEYPSGARNDGEGVVVGDVHLALTLEEIFFRNHKQGRIADKVVVIFPEGPNRVLSYGVTKSSLAYLKNIISEAQNAKRDYDVSFVAYTASENKKERSITGNILDVKEKILENARFNLVDYIDRLDKEYNRYLSAYLGDHCSSWTVNDCLEPDICEFIADVNVSENLFVEDCGWYKRLE